MPISLNKFLIFLLILIISAVFYTSKHHSHSAENNPNATDEEICDELQDPATLPFISYSTTEGFNECVSRCMTSAMIQICPQLPQNSNVFATHPEIKQKLFDDCTEHIKQFIVNGTRCPYLNCEP